MVFSLRHRHTAEVHNKVITTCTQEKRILLLLKVMC